MIKNEARQTRRKKTRPELEEERKSNRDKLSQNRAPLRVVVDNVRSLDNVGLLFRLCELSRVERLYLCGISGYPKGQKNDRRPLWKIERADQRIRKTAIYAVPFVPWEYHRRAISVVQKLREDGFKIIVLEQAHGSLDYAKIEYTLPLALVVGHELRGVSQNIIETADAVAEIPTFGLGNSLNVAVATGIVLYKIIEKTGFFDKID